MLATSLVPFSSTGHDPGHGTIQAVLQHVAGRTHSLSPASARSLLGALTMLQATHERSLRSIMTADLWNSLMRLAVKDLQPLLKQGDAAQSPMLTEIVGLWMLSTALQQCLQLCSAALSTLLHPADITQLPPASLPSST